MYLLKNIEAFFNQMIEAEYGSAILLSRNGYNRKKLICNRNFNMPGTAVYRRNLISNRFSLNMDEQSW